MKGDLRFARQQERGVHAASSSMWEETLERVASPSAVRVVKRRERRAPVVTPFVIAWLLFTATLHALPMRKTNDAIPELAPPLPEMPPTFWEQHGWWLWVIVPLVLLVVAVVTAFVWLRPRKPPLLPATAAQARAALTALQARAEDGAALVEISLTLRRYLITTFWLPAGEATTAEFCARLAKNEQVGAELSGAVGEFLRACDERKFSPAPAGPFEAAGRALKLVEQAEARQARLHAVTQIPKSA